jgi:hypothetical protein
MEAQAVAVVVQLSIGWLKLSGTGVLVWISIFLFKLPAFI